MGVPFGWEDRSFRRTLILQAVCFNFTRFVAELIENVGTPRQLCDTTPSSEPNIETMASGTKRVKPRTLAIGVVGIGRIGRQHALNALHNVNRTELLCACSPAPADLEWADEHLIPYGVNVYKTFEEMIAEPGLEAVIVASTTKFHHNQVRECIKRGLHVLCEKPLSMTVPEARSIVELSQKKENAHLKVMTAFSRRFDDSYLNAMKAISSGKIGTPVVVRSETRDKFDDSPFYHQYIMANPGIFIDTAVHDIDLTLAFLGNGLRPKSCHAIGNIARHHKLAEIADVDNATGCVEWYPPSPGAVAPISYYFFSRIMKHGFDNPTEVIGTEGVLKVNLHPRKHHSSPVRDSRLSCFSLFQNATL